MKARRKSVIVVTGVTSVAVAVLIGLAASSSSPARGGTGSTSAVAGVTWLCGHAAQEVAGGQANGFLAWVNGKCSSEGPAGVLAHLRASGQLSTAPSTAADGASATTAPNVHVPSGAASATGGGVGALMCEYATQQVAKGATTTLDKIEARQCAQSATPPSPPVPSSEILSSVQQPPLSTQMRASNAWQGSYNGEEVTVRAGAKVLNLADPKPTTVGAVVRSTSAQGFQTFFTQQADGPLTATSEANGVVSLTAKDGATYQFDLATDALTRTGS